MVNQIKIGVSVDNQLVYTVSVNYTQTSEGTIKIGQLDRHDYKDVETDKLILELLQEHVEGMEEAIKIREQDK